MGLVQTGLTSFDLEHNQLTHLPDGLYRGLTNLKRLALSNNALSELSPGQHTHTLTLTLTHTRP
jgi:Leucine-rich repeat (LRR) protein